jgi:ABC-2 type transport system permease protein
MQYRLSFGLQVVGVLGATFLDFIAILILFSRVSSLGGWSLWEVAFLYGTSYLPFTFADMFVGRIERLGEWIRTGQFDVVLARPLGTLGQALTSDADVRKVGAFAQGATVFGLALANTHVAWTPAKLLVLVLMLLSGFVIFCSVWIGTNAAAFWLVNVREASNAFTYGGNFVTQYPLDIFATWFRRLFAFVIPIAFVNFFPSLFILDKPSDPWPAAFRFASPFVAVGTVAVAAIVWRAGIRRYTSTGS